MQRSTVIALAWVLCVMSIAAAYHFVSASTFEHAELAKIGLLAVLAVGFVLFVSLWWRSLRRGHRINEEGVRLLQRGHYSAALEKFEEARRGQEKLYLFRLNAAIARVMLLQLDVAIAELAQITSAGAVPAFHRNMAFQYLALAKALSGSSSDAELSAWWQDGAPVALLAVAVALTRRHAWQDAESVLARPEIHQLGGFHRALADTLRAMCAKHLRSELRPIDWAALFGEADPDPLLARWPELAAILGESRA